MGQDMLFKRHHMYGCYTCNEIEHPSMRVTHTFNGTTIKCMCYPNTWMFYLITGLTSYICYRYAMEKLLKVKFEQLSHSMSLTNMASSPVLALSNS